MTIAHRLEKKYKATAAPKSFLARVEILASEIDDEADAGALDKAKSFLKKAIVPALMLFGPVACGVQEPGEDKVPQAQQLVNKDLSAQGIKCVIDTDDDSMTWSFKDSEGDSVVFKLPVGETSVTRNAIEVVKEPKTEKMENFMNAAMDSFEYGLKNMEKKYECDITPQKLAPTQPDLP